jgi:hypothetical protein
MAGTLPLLALLALPIVIPVLLGDTTLYKWADHAKLEEKGDTLTLLKAPYLNGLFFAVRMAFYFLVWILLARFFMRNSVPRTRRAIVSTPPRWRSGLRPESSSTP